MENLKLADLELAHTRELADRDREIADLSAQLGGAVVERTAREALTDVGCQATELLTPILVGQLRAERADGRTEVRVVDAESGRPRVALEGPVSVHDAALELKHAPQYSRFFRG